MIPFSVHAEKGEGRCGTEKEGRDCLFDGKTEMMVSLLCIYFFPVFFFLFFFPWVSDARLDRVYFNCAAVSSSVSSKVWDWRATFILLLLAVVCDL